MRSSTPARRTCSRCRAAAGRIGFRLRLEMREQSRSSLVGRRPAQPIGEIGREPRQVLHHAGEGPVDEGDVVRPRRGARFSSTRSMPGVSSSRCHSLGRQPAKTRPRGPACAGTTHTTVRRAQLAAAREEGFGRVEEAPAWSRPARCRGRWRRSIASSQPLATMCGGTCRRASRARMVGDGSIAVHGRRDPAARRRAGRRPRRHRAACRCRARAGAPAAPRAKHSRRYRSPRHRARADRCRTDPSSGRETERRTRQTRGTSTVTANRAARRLRMAAKRPFHIRTPRPMRSRVTAASGRSPGSRVLAFDHLPRRPESSSGFTVEGSPLTVAGAAAALLKPRTAFPFDPLREPLRRISGSGSAKRQRVKTRSPV